MSKPVVILAESDDKYLASLETKFLGELYEKIELEVITDSDYFSRYFSSPRKAEVLVVGENLYNSDLHKHNLDNIFVLSEGPSKSVTDDLSIKIIYKYSSLKEIFNEIMYALSSGLLGDDPENKETELVMVYSAIGGSGKTTAALGVSACLTANHKKAIYLNGEHVNNFQHHLTSKAFITNEAYKEFDDKNEQLYCAIKPYLKNEGFDYLPPFSASLSSLNIRFSFFETLIKQIKEAKEYHYIILDTDSGFDEQKASLMAMADKVLMIMNQDSYSSFKMTVMQKNINCSDNNKYIFVCNKYKESSPNMILSGDARNRIVISEYIEHIENCDRATIEKLTEVEGLQRIAYMLI